MSLLNYLNESNRKVEIKDLQILNKNIKAIQKNSIDKDINTPIDVKNNNSWEILSNPERLNKTYTFENMKACMYFFNEIYKYQFTINHHCKIIIDNLTLSIETYTHGYDGITELDQKIKKYCDELESDLNYFKN